MIEAEQRAGRAETGLRGSQDAVLDLAHLDRQTDGDKALQRELLTLFAEQAAEIAGRIRAGDRPAELAHRLKGAARAVGAWGVAEAAGRIEEGSGGPGALDVAVRQAMAAVARRLAGD